MCLNTGSDCEEKKKAERLPLLPPIKGEKVTFHLCGSEQKRFSEAERPAKRK